MKRGLALLCLALLTVSAGCTGANLGLGGGEQQQEQTPASSVQYDWNTSADVTIDLGTDRYRSVYSLDQRTLSVYNRGLINPKSPIDVQAVKYRYPNGTVITTNENEAFTVTTSGQQTEIHVPEPAGKVAFTAGKSSRSFSTPVFQKTDSRQKKANNLSYEIILPPNTEVAIPILSSVKPGEYETETIDGRVHVTWKSVTAESVSVRYYLHRDLLIFGSIVGVAIVVGLVGVGYYLVQLRRLKQLREEVSLSVGDNNR